MNAKNIVYTDASFRHHYFGNVAIADEHKNLLFFRAYSNVCCIECLELRAMYIARKLYPEAMIFADNVGAIRRFLYFFPNARVIHVRGFRNLADSFTRRKATNEETIRLPDSEYEQYEISHDTVKYKGIKPMHEILSKTDVICGRVHLHLIVTKEGEQYVSSSRLKKYLSEIKKQNNAILFS